MTNRGSSRCGLNFVEALQLLFIALKLMGYIDWPWYGVLAPLLIDLLLVVVFFVIAALYSIINKI